MNQAIALLAEDIYTPCQDFSPGRLAELDESGRREFWATLALRHTPGLGARRQARLLRKFGSALAACEHCESWREAGVPVECANAYKCQAWRESAKSEWNAARSLEASLLLWSSAAYPQCLRSIPDPPALLYCVGNIGLLSGPCIAIVGTRQPTEHSRHVTAAFAASLAQCGITIVSGMAMGIDREAHLGALKGAGSSMGVLGTGIDIQYPKSNRDIYAQMRDSGLLISEFQPGLMPASANFPIRNRIISGIALGVIVIEAATRSGSLITARLALEQNREVFAVPGPALNAHSLGCQNLVRQGARAVFCVDDILRDLQENLRPYVLSRPGICTSLPPEAAPEKPDRPKKAKPHSQEEPPGLAPALTALMSESDKILSCFRESDTLDLDGLAAVSGMDPTALNAALLGLEMAGRIERLPGARYRLIP